MGYLFGIIAGASMSVQGVMNTRLSEKIGLYYANLFVSGISLILSLILFFIFNKTPLGKITEANKLYLLGGVLGIVITFTVMITVQKLSPTLATSTILVSQLLVSSLIDAFGLMDSKVITFSWNKYLALAMLIAGVVLFKLDFGK